MKFGIQFQFTICSKISSLSLSVFFADRRELRLDTTDSASDSNPALSLPLQQKTAISASNWLLNTNSQLSQGLDRSLTDTRLLVSSSILNNSLYEQHHSSSLNCAINRLGAYGSCDAPPQRTERFQSNASE